jgi:hypothetical protein
MAQNPRPITANGLDLPIQAERRREILACVWYNLGWLVSYIFGSVSIYYLCAACHRHEMPRWTQPLTVTTTLILIAVFPLGPARAPESAYHAIPFNFAELSFMAALYVLCVPVCSSENTPE